MQYKDAKTLHLRKTLGNVIKALREKRTGLSCTKLGNEYGINSKNLNKIENSLIDCKLITAWKISEALGLKFSDFAKILEEELGDDFKLIDE